MLEAPLSAGVVPPGEDVADLFPLSKEEIRRLVAAWKSPGVWDGKTIAGCPPEAYSAFAELIGWGQRGLLDEDFDGWDPSKGSFSGTIGLLTAAVPVGISKAALKAAIQRLARSAGAGSIDEALSGLAAGRSGGVRVVSSADELDDLFAGLSRGGSQVESTYPGKLVRLSDGSTVGLRGASRSGGPTMDVRLPDGRTIKVHVDPWPPAG